MHMDILMLFEKWPAALPLYEALERHILEAYPDVKYKVGKTQVSFSNRYGFAYLWPPIRRIKGRPGTYVGLTFGLPYKKEHPRIVEAVEPYPNRWTHHTLVADLNDIDAVLMDWIRESYEFSMHK